MFFSRTNSATRPTSFRSDFYARTQKSHFRCSATFRHRVVLKKRLLCHVRLGARVATRTHNSLRTATTDNNNNNFYFLAPFRPRRRTLSARTPTGKDDNIITLVRRFVLCLRVILSDFFAFALLGRVNDDVYNALHAQRPAAVFCSSRRCWRKSRRALRNVTTTIIL